MGWRGCVSDDQNTASADGNSSPQSIESTSPSTTAPDSSTTEESTSTSGPTSSSGDADSDDEARDTESDGDTDSDKDADSSSVDSEDNTSDSTERTQGAPITVTTIGSDAVGKKSVSSNVTVTDSWCEASEAGSLLAFAEIANAGTLEGDFIVEFEVLNALGVRVGEGLDVVYEVKPGQSFIARETVTDAVGWEGDARSWTCQVLRISTPDAVLGE